MHEYDVVIVGAGPTGIMLGAELALAGVQAIVLERRETPDAPGSRAGGLHARTIELLDQRGIVDRFLAAGTPLQVAGFAGVPLDISDFPSRHPYGLALWQNRFELILRGWAQELGVRVIYGQSVTDISADADGVRVDVIDGPSRSARYLVGTDGGRSAIRQAARIDFAGWDPTVSNLIAEVEMTEEPVRGAHRNALGFNAMTRMPDKGPIRVVITEKRLNHGEATLSDLRAALVEEWGTDFGVHSPTWISRFTDATRQASSYRTGRVLLAGDAAHVHYPVGGQGLNLGIGDAVNLGWKLAQAARGTSADALLDTYQAERHPVASRVVRDTMAQVALNRADPRSEAARDTIAEMLMLDETRRQVGGRMSGLDIRYDLGDGHPLLGRRMPDLDLTTPAGTARVYDFLHEARPLLMEFAASSNRQLGAWSPRVQRVEARADGDLDLPVIGAVTRPDAVLVRPDGYVAWTSDDAAPLDDALAAWFGPV